MKIQQQKKLTFCCKRGIQLYVESPNYVTVRTESKKHVPYNVQIPLHRNNCKLT